ncbi:poly-beta-1,6-N-acetyl-D-glucosamine synthase [Burkholderiaceae bacterium FT117]|uniref:poly-beta-1,6-N-acetyl-D-glucosamine synthase n=1 Tax=Zeimonas sediminis TaxID=2944268 RepID=UPI00234311EC|nr:poly-beta-1,6-N-acetyl-D-glucosamine synthase [Zeimonas sediminis]MCM5571526.1 poly-beta-1,6-N-acetyl-D-glucosamine synthase [Zeimonas sediminis]
MSTTIASIGEALADFAFYYPLFMAWLWMAGALFYWFHYERRGGKPHEPPPLDEFPSVAVVVPCFNEEAHADETIGWLMKSRYPNLEVIAVDDGSTDDTGAVLERLAARYPSLRVVRLLRNQGKAAALNTAATMTHAEILVCIDGDALLDPWAIHWMVWHFRWPRVGAVTGNPRVRTRSTLLGRLQIGEFSSTIGLIKRAQRTYGRVFTVSGVVAAFRRSALHDVGYWSTDMLTEDVDISWKLQARHWDVRFEPNALCWILMPETLRGLWKQRLRWAAGGMQVLKKNLLPMRAWRQRRMWPVFLEYLLSAFWAYTMLGLFLAWTLRVVFGIPTPIEGASLIPRWPGVVIGTTCLLQIGIGMLLDHRIEKGLFRYYFWMIWYPLAFWLLSALTTVVGVPKALFRTTGKRARWKSPDRGLLPQDR